METPNKEVKSSQIKKWAQAPKVGSEFKMDNDYPEIYVEGGVINKQKMDTIYLKISSHMFADDDQGVQELKYFFWGIKQTISKFINPEFYKKEFISVLEFSDSFRFKPYSNTIMDFTIYTACAKHRNFHQQFLNDLVHEIHSRNIVSSPFRMYKHKKMIDASEDIGRVRTFT